VANDHHHDEHEHETQEFEPPAHRQETEQTVYRREPAEERVAEREILYRSSWSPAQIVALIAGVFFIVMGGIALARGGFGDFTAHVEVGGFHHTPVLGLVELLLGILLLAMGAIPGVDRTGLIFLGALFFAFGLVLAFQGESFHGLLATHSNNGWLYVLIGGILLIVALVAPVILEDRSRRIYGRSRY
jgi:hypothetical protein